MLHSCTPSANKESIIKSFSEECGVIRVLIATIAFGMGTNCQAVSRVIHFGPAKNIGSYAQETGRAGRGGSQAVAYLLYNGILLNHVEWDMKSYVRNDMCRRMICDYCASKCECGSSDCGTLTTYPSKVLRKEPESKLRSRGITNEQREAVHEKLTIYHKMLISNLVSTSAKTELKTLTDISLVLGFSELQIQQVLGNLHYLFSLLDICKFVEIWDMMHAHKILSIIKEIFEHVQDNTCDVANDEYEIDDTGLLEDWETIIEDDELFAMAVGNLSVSQLDESFTEQSANLSGASLDMSLYLLMYLTIYKMGLCI
jgi:hypothetical protein